MKIIKKALCAIMMLFILTCSSANVSAAEPLNEKTIFSNYVTEGYTDEGIHYIAFQYVQPNGIISPQLIDYKKVSCNVTFDGNIVPPETWNFTTKVKSITYKGILYLRSYSYDNFLWSKKTIATYSGTVAAGL